MNRVGKPSLDIETEILALRITKDMAKRIDTYIRFCTITQGIKLSKNQVGKQALDFLLQSVEKDYKK